MKRRVHENIALDQSLRQSRSIWLTLALVLLPFAALGLLLIAQGIVPLFESSPDAQGNESGTLNTLLLGALFIAVDVFSFRQVLEAWRRLRLLHRDPNADIRPLPAPFASSLFGPYH